jgi:hypothetical protein
MKILIKIVKIWHQIRQANRARNSGRQRSAIHSIFRDPRPGHYNDSRPPSMDGHTCTGGGIKIPLKGVPRGAPGTEKINGMISNRKE